MRAAIAKRIVSIMTGLILRAGEACRIPTLGCGCCRDGLFCEPGGFFVDPVRPVDRAVITHAHADHARPGHAHVLASPETLAIMRVRMGEDRAGTVQQAQPYGEAVTVGEVRVWLQPAGHVLGAAQVAMEWRGSRAVVSGDYKRAADPTCAPFEPIPCDVFVTEATFALPVFRHPPPATRSASCWTAWRCSRSGPTSSAPMRWASASG